MRLPRRTRRAPIRERQPVTFTATSLTTYFQCGERYRLRFTEGIKTSPNTSLIVGRAVDESVTADLRQKMATGKLLDPGSVVENVRDEVERIVARDGMGSNEEEIRQGNGRTIEGMKRRAGILASLHHSIVAPRIEATEVQRKFNVPIAGHELSGTVDIVEGCRSIRDTKTANRSPSEDAADTSLQLTIYAAGVRTQEVILDHLISTAAPKVVTLRSSRTRESFAMLEERIAAAASAIQAGVFIPADPSDWRCSERYCPYFQICRFAMRPVR